MKEINPEQKLSALARTDIIDLEILPVALTSVYIAQKIPLLEVIPKDTKVSSREGTRQYFILSWTKD